MSHNGENEGIRVLDDFVCKAIHGPDFPKPDVRHPGQSAGIQVVEESVCVATRREASPATDVAHGEKGLPSVELDDSVELMIKRLAACVIAQDDPFRILALVQQRLIAEMDADLSSNKTLLDPSNQCRDESERERKGAD